MISVIIPLYNKERQIACCLNSILNQSFTDFEIIVIDDGSTDTSVDVVKGFNDERIRVVSQSNSGVSAARNRGIKEAHGQYVAFIDADDEWYAHYLEEQINLINEYADCGIFATNYEFVMPSGKKEATILKKLPFDSEHGILDNYFECASYSHPPLWTSAIVVRKTLIEDIGGFPVGIRSGEDLLTWARLAEKKRIAFSKKVSAIYNLGEGYDFSNLPPRRQDADDPVGKAFKAILKRNPNITGLRRYVSHWHKMRASVAIRYGERWETLKEVYIALWYNPTNFKVLPFVALAIVPTRLRNLIISRYKK